MAKEPSPLWSEESLKSFRRQDRLMFAALIALIILLTFGAIK